MCTGAPVDRNMSEAPLSIINFRKYPMSMSIPQRMMSEKKQERGQRRQSRAPHCNARACEATIIALPPVWRLMTRLGRKFHRLVPLFGIPLLASCATTPPPTALMDRAEAQIHAAAAAGAATRAPGDFAEAQRRYAFAQAAINNGDNDQAAASAEEAAAAAETARARARDAELRERIQNQRDENASLRADLEQKQAQAEAAQQAASQPVGGASSEELPPIQLSVPQPGAQLPVGSSAPAPADSSDLPPAESSAPPAEDQSLPAPPTSSGAFQGSGS
ncbi:MAG: hypothetical protein C4338_03310 [Rhodanobacteraceae bacterium]